jgi:16S rRNA C967 or C1407 C5-methylase (RsmB/RsmF family)
LKGIGNLPSGLVKLSEKIPSITERNLFLEAMNLSCKERGKSCVVFRDKITDLPNFIEFDHQLTKFMPNWVKLLNSGDTIGTNPLYTNGDIYPLDLSSVLSGLVAILGLTGKTDLTICDACSAPGGKAVLLWRGLTPKRLVCNETIQQRVPILLSNLKRCRITPVEVSSLEIPVLVAKCGRSFDLVIADVPCSSQSLYHQNGLATRGAFNPHLIKKNIGRQRFILSHLATLVKTKGYILYSTCTFSLEENEGMIDWFIKNNSEYKLIKVPQLEIFSSKFADFPCYRFLPYATNFKPASGLGSFSALLKREADDKPEIINKTFFNPIWQG